MQSLADIKADDSGSWKNNGVCSVSIFVINDDVWIVAQENSVTSTKWSVLSLLCIKQVNILGKYFLLEVGSINTEDNICNLNAVLQTTMVKILTLLWSSITERAPSVQATTWKFKE